jgi:peptidyl-prolyl cis-trans isomerase C
MRRTSLLPSVTLAIAALAVLSSLACHRKAIRPDVVATVGDRMITLEDFKRYLQRNAGTELAQTAPEASSALLDQYIEESLFSEYAMAHGIDIPAEKVAAAVRNDPGSTVMEKRDEMRRNELVRRIEEKLPPPVETDIRRYYDQHPQEFNLPERVHARQILVHEEAAAQEAAKKLQGGASFEEVSRQYSKAPNASQGGDLGFVGRGQMPKVFEDDLFQMKPGTISRVISTENNTFHIFKVESYAPAGPVPFETASPTIRARLQTEAMDAEMTRLLTEGRKDIPARILARRLPFEYSGSFPRGDE